MITVRFPSGFSVQYNNLDATSEANDGRILLKKSSDPGHWYVSAPAGCLIEFTRPCETYNAADKDAWEQVAALRREIASLKRKIAKEQAR